MRTAAADALRDELSRVASVGVDRHEFACHAAGVLRRAVPFDAVAAVWFDPATGLPVDQWVDHAENVLHEPDFGTFQQLADSGRRAARENNELQCVCVGDSGMWGAIVMRRDRGAPHFTRREVALLASLSARFEEVQRTRLERDLAAEATARDRGLLVLDAADRIEMADAAAAVWLDELRGGRPRLPLAVTAVADRARAVASGNSDLEATARVRTASGRWVFVRGSMLGSRTAVTLEPARAPQLAGLIADAYCLTERERRVTDLVAQGLPTAAIAEQLYLSAYTVQDHLKAIFEKLGVSSRGELVAKLFVDHSLSGDGRLRP